MNYPKKNCGVKKEKRNWKNSTWSKRKGKGEKKKNLDESKLKIRKSRLNR